MTSTLTQVYRGVLWLAVLGTIAAPSILLTQPARLDDGLLLSVLIVSISFVVAGLVSWLGMLVRRRHEVVRGSASIYATTLRQGALAGIATFVILALQLMRVVTAIDVGIIVALAIVLELYLGSRGVQP